MIEVIYDRTEVIHFHCLIIRHRLVDQPRDTGDGDNGDLTQPALCHPTQGVRNRTMCVTYSEPTQGEVKMRQT